MDRPSTISLLAVGVGGALAIAAFRSVHKSRHSEVKADAAEEEEEETFASHACDHDGKGLVELSPGRLWCVYATFKGNGPPWRRMVVYRPRNTRKLILLSPVAVREDVMLHIESLGEVDVLVVPNSYHRSDVGVFKARYPSSKVACPPGEWRKRVSEVVQVDMDCRELSRRYGDEGEDPVIRVVRIGGIGDPDDETEGDFEYAYEFRLSDKTWAYAVTDTLFNFPDAGFMNWVFGCRGIVRPDGSVTPRVGRISRWFMYSRAKCAEFYRGMAERDDVSFIIMAHGNVLSSGIKDAFAAIADNVAS